MVLDLSSLAFLHLAAMQQRELEVDVVKLSKHIQ